MHYEHHILPSTKHIKCIENNHEMNSNPRPYKDGFASASGKVSNVRGAEAHLQLLTPTRGLFIHLAAPPQHAAVRVKNSLPLAQRCPVRIIQPSQAHHHGGLLSAVPDSRGWQRCCARRVGLVQKKNVAVACGACFRLDYCDC